MIYFYTNILVYSIVEEDVKKTEISQKLIYDAIHLQYVMKYCIEIVTFDKEFIKFKNNINFNIKIVNSQ